MHVQAFDWIAGHAAGLRPASVLEVGSLDINGSVRPLFADAAHYHGVDLVAGPGVDEVADAADWTPQQRYDVVVSAEVLEHTSRWRAVLDTMWAALAPGGTLLVTGAAPPRAPHSAVDGLEVRDGEHYANVAPTEALAHVRGWPAGAFLVEWAAGRGDLYLRVDRPADP
jgi:hypothetical protein